MPLTTEMALAYWYRALECKVGLAIGTDDKRFLINKLYDARRNLGDTSIQSLVIMDPPGINEVWICHEDQEVPE